MKKILAMLLLTAGASIGVAQTTDTVKQKLDSVQVKITKLEDVQDSIVDADTIRYWKLGGGFGMNFNQSSFTNWAAGGEDAISTTGLVNLFANYKKGHWTWDNNIDLGYGVMKSGGGPFRKNEDKIDLTTKVGRYAFKDRWYYSAMLNFKSQFDKGYNFPDDTTVISHFLAPAFVIGSLGLDYKSKDESLSLFISPLTSKTTIVYNQDLADAGAFGVNPAAYDSVASVYVLTEHGDMVRSEFGGYIKLTFKKEVMKNVTYATKLELFSNYLENPENIDVLWENIITMKVNRLIAASITTNLIYDHDIPVPVTREQNGVFTKGTGPRLQFKEVLAIGLSYKFGK
jgi:hypothetical protein